MIKEFAQTVHANDNLRCRIRYWELINIPYELWLIQFLVTSFLVRNGNPKSLC